MSKPVRRSQAISPFGVGAMVDFPGPISLIHVGLDHWPYDPANSAHEEFRIADEYRLARRLKVDYFVEPPDYRHARQGVSSGAGNQANLELRLPFRRFPLSHVCPECKRMSTARFQDRNVQKCTGRHGSRHKPREPVQVRFIAVCREGHIQDIPWNEWLHGNANPGWLPDGETRWLQLDSKGSASASGIEISAVELQPCGGVKIVKTRTLGGIFEGDASRNLESALTKIKVMCAGCSPVVGTSPGNTDSAVCGGHLYAMLRGASSVYFPQVVSSIYIPEIDENGTAPDILDLLEDQRFRSSLLDKALESESGLVSVISVKNSLKKLKPHLNLNPEEIVRAANRRLPKEAVLQSPTACAFLTQQVKASENKALSEQMICDVLAAQFDGWNIAPAILLEQLAADFETAAGEDKAAGNDESAENDYRHQEYRVFCSDRTEGRPRVHLMIRSESLAIYGASIKKYISRISLLHKLRETRAFVGYSRIIPQKNLSPQKRAGTISKNSPTWLPAIVVRGEGIFIELSEHSIGEWLATHGEFHTRRLSQLNDREEKRAKTNGSEFVLTDPKFVLLHTLAHLIINQLVFDSGYSSAALRERIYCASGEFPMSGILIYTAAGDSEGTMGGLVKMGGSDFLEGVLRQAIGKAAWCSTDPVCIESKGQGPENCNLAACHACALLPETSCEEQNRRLDRAVVTGTFQHPDVGFFSDFD